MVCSACHCKSSEQHHLRISVVPKAAIRREDKSAGAEGGGALAVEVVRPKHCRGDGGNGGGKGSTTP